MEKPTAAPVEVAVPTHARPQLDGIQAARGIAALLVVAFHLTGLSQRIWHETFAGNFFDFGWAGVDLFFVLSGFIIYYVHGRDIARPDRLRPYAWRRFARIYPIYIIVTLAVLPIYLAGWGEAAKRDPGVIIRSFLLLPQPTGVFPVVTVGWSLSFEALFYLLFGLLIVLPRRAGRVLFGGWMAASAGAAIYHVFYGPGFAPAHPAIAFLVDGRNLEFGLGFLVGWAIRRGVVRGGAAMLAGGVASFLLAGWNVDREWTSFAVTLAWLGVSAAAIVYGVAALDLQRRRRVPSALRLVGDASYSIYLTHGLALNALVPLGHKVHLAERIGAVPAQLLCFGIAVGAGLIVYAAVEKPILRWLRPGMKAKEAAPARVALES